MSTTVTNVSVGKPAFGGAVHWAPIGTTLPTDATTALAEAFVDMGYISEDGVSNSTERETDDIKAWGGDVVLSPQNGFTDTFSMTFIESLNADVLKRIYGEENVSGSLSDGISVKVNSKELEYGVWVIDMVLTEDAKQRIVIPNGKITELGEISYTDGDAIGYEATIKAFPGADGDTHKSFIKRA